MTNYVVAGIVGLVNVLGLFTIAQFIYARSWASRGVEVAATLALLVLGVGTGLLSVAAASKAGWSSNGALQGLGSSLLGAAALRADIGKSDAPRQSGAKSAATPAAKAVFKLLDGHCRRRVERWALDLAPADLITAAEIVPARDSVRGQRAQLLQNAQTALLGGGTAAIAARGQLVRFITKTYSAERFPKPHL
jgi:hypothetical protein